MKIPKIKFNFKRESSIAAFLMCFGLAFVFHYYWQFQLLGCLIYAFILFILFIGAFIFLDSYTLKERDEKWIKKK